MSWNSGMTYEDLRQVKPDLVIQSIDGRTQRSASRGTGFGTVLQATPA
jgi:crotonobetainyl-CoA:carnitine CoA-transferase CaiB-like acyl-CoA transferase